MFKREIKIGLGKAGEENTQTDEEKLDALISRTSIIADAMEKTVKKIIIGVGVYIAADTARQVIVERAKK